jgi:multiple sugar transport system substrate-binding protein
MLVAVVIGCSTTPGSLPSGSDQTTITWFAGSAELENDPSQAIVQAFERAHPDITVNLVTGPYNTDDKRSAVKGEIRSGKHQPDVYLGDVIWPAEFGRAGLALPLDRHFPPEFWARFRQGSDNRLLEASRHSGKTYAVPLYEDQGLLYYRKDLLEKRGLRPPATWQELVKIWKQLRSARVVRWGFIWQGAPYEGLTCFWLELLRDAGGRIIDESGRKANIVSTQALTATSFLRSLIDEQVTPEYVTEFEEPHATDLFSSGQVAFMRGWNSAYSLISRKLDEKGQNVEDMVGVVELPTFDGQPRPGFSTVGGWSLFVNPKTTKLKAALTFIDWMTDTAAQGITAKASEIPANTRARLDTDNSSDTANPALAVAVKVKMKAIRPAYIPAYSELSAAIYENVHDFLTGTATSPEAALTKADAQADRVLAATGSGGHSPAGRS